MRNKLTGDDYLDFLVSAMVAFFSILIGGSWFVGLLLEPDKSEFFLLLCSLGLLLGGIGCAIHCFYLLTKKIYKFIYYGGLIVIIVSYLMAVIGAAIYNQS